MYWAEFLTIAIAHLFAVASPGPDFAIVVRQTIAQGTRAGVWTSLGVGSGILLHVAYCLLGVAVLLTSSPRLFTVVKSIAAVYMLYLAFQSFRASLRHIGPSASEDIAAEATPRIAFTSGFLTNGLNPKATLFFLALFTVVIAPDTPLIVQALYGLYLAVATFLWFAMLSQVMGRTGVRSFMLRAGVWFERGMGLILLVLGLQILLYR